MTKLFNAIKTFKVTKIVQQHHRGTFYSKCSFGVQVWYSLHRGEIKAHLEDHDTIYTGAGKGYKEALRDLEKVVPSRYESTINYMRCCLG